MPLASLSFAICGLIAAVVAALLLPGKLFEYITTAAGILILFNWTVIVFSNIKLLNPHFFSMITFVLSILLMFAALAVIGLESTDALVSI
ncbi:hypothetical protein [Shouchella patagoniensis]|uniref:hypothetical protein n=1 Tax=Shouchella patagoniensis TaxID=228576 RepID=UPI001FE732CE|nr:hypothetical protein [Shouchella patagoniensis]